MDTITLSEKLRSLDQMLMALGRPLAQAESNYCRRWIRAAATCLEELEGLEDFEQAAKLQKEQNDKLKKEIKALEKQLKSAKGQITKLKNKGKTNG